MRCVRALLVLVAVAAVSSPAMAQEKATDTGRARLERQLSRLEQRWMAAERGRKMDYLKDVWTGQFFDVLPGGGVETKEGMLKFFNDTPAKPDSGGFPNDFKLRAVYGNFAIATDHTTIKGSGAYNGEYRCIRMFVKENGKWKVAGSAIVGIASSK